jgi:hypothetical protein
LPLAKIVRAILSGERNALILAKLRHGRILASEENIIKALQGSWREEHLFALKQAVNLHDSYQAAIAECDLQLTRALGRLAFTTMTLRCLRGIHGATLRRSKRTICVRRCAAPAGSI